LHGASGGSTSCEWRVPDPEPGQEFNPYHVILQVEAGDAGAKTTLYQVSVRDDCASLTTAWFYDNPNAPTHVALCPETCRRFLALPGARLLFVAGCSGPFDYR
jgi:hypothetical protein